MKFKELIVQLKRDSKKYQFCEEGVDGINKAASALQCCVFLRENIVYCFDSKYHDAIAENIEVWYKQWRKEFHQCGIWVNERSPKENGLIIWNSTNCCRGFGKERVFLFGEKGVTVQATGHAKVYSKNPYAYILLYGHSHGFIRCSIHISVLDNATCYAEKSEIYSAAKCRLFLSEDCLWKVDLGYKTYEKIQHLAFQ